MELITTPAELAHLARHFSGVDPDAEVVLEVLESEFSMEFPASYFRQSYPEDRAEALSTV